MSDGSTNVFFYGLFMDPTLLRAQGYKPSEPRRASVAEMALRIGERASLVPCKGAVTYGTVMSLNDAELKLLYAEPSVAAYRPEQVTALFEDGSEVSAICYNLPASAETAGNPEYATKLRAVGEKMGLPVDYIRSIN